MHNFEIRRNDQHLCYVICETDEELLGMLKAFRNDSPERGSLSIVITAPISYADFIKQFKVDTKTFPRVTR